MAICAGHIAIDIFDGTKSTAPWKSKRLASVMAA